MIECFILAGGLSRRFGKDKLLHFIGDKRSIEHVIDALSKVCDRIYVVAKDVDKFSFLTNVRIIKDLIDKQYALAGVYTALRSFSGEKALIISGDMPLVKKEVVKYLLENSSPPLTLYRIKDKYYPLFAVYYKELLESIENYINSGGEKLMDFILSIPRKEIGEEEILKYDAELVSFINMNTIEDERLILKHYGREGNKN